MPGKDGSKEQLTASRRLVYFAAERTLMAWIRAAVGLMALGFVIDRFGLVLRQITHSGAAQEPNAFSFWSGTALVVVGAVMVLTAAARYWRFAVAYRNDRATRPGHGIMLGIAFAVLVGALGFGVAAFLLTVGG